MVYEEDAVFHFPHGLPGFEEETRFLPIEQPYTRPILFLQSLRQSGLCFITLPVRVVDPEYRLAVPPEDLDLLELPLHRQPKVGSEVLCLTILTIRPGEPTTANLLAPVVVHLGSRRAVQAVSAEPAYSSQFPLSTDN
jgi:flagellar assembly factor FliW